MSELLVLEREKDGFTELAVLDGKNLVEYKRSEGTGASIAGSILLGRVERVLPELKAAFVNIGRKKNAFLPLRDSESFHKLCGPAPLITGNSVLVQVQKDEKGEKGAFLTRDLSLPGVYVILMPMNRFFGVSRRVGDEKERKALQRLGKRIADGRFGLVMRQAALFADEETVRSEAEQLFEKWQKLSFGYECKKAPCVLMERESESAAVCRDYAPRHEIRCVKSSEQSEETDWLWRECAVERQLKAALERKVSLPGGETLIIDEREALQTIDVNSATHVTEENSLPFIVNRNAVSEIARQIRLRNLSGILLIDFVNMEKESERVQIAAALEEALADDRVKYVIHGFTRLGLLEMTRKRSGPSLLEMTEGRG